MNFEITTKNVEYLWKLYEEYLQYFKDTHYSDDIPTPFEEMTKNMVYCENTNEYHWKEDTFYCNNCQCYYHEDEQGSSELALQDSICEYCMENGYGN